MSNKMDSIQFTVNVDEKLAVDKYEVDEETAHIKLNPNISDDDFAKLMLACPAALYKRGENDEKVFDYAGCLECGTCRVLCLADGGLEKWEYPLGTMGIEYRYG